MDTKQIVQKANFVKGTLTGDFEQVRKIVENNDLVFAVWQDQREPDGVGTMVVKGQQQLREIASGAKAETIKWNAIPCISIEQAEALRQLAGEKDRRN